jgi:tetratricopeptide (TPR) repeat protein
MKPKNLDYIMARGYAWIQLKAWAKAEADYTEALCLDPNSIGSYRNRAIARDQQGTWATAAADCTELLQRDPKDVVAYRSRADAWNRLGKWEKALSDLDELLRLDPKSVHALTTRAWIRVSCRDKTFRDGPSAVADATRACELKEWKDPWCLGVLAGVLSAVGRFDDAVKWQKKALEDPAYAKIEGEHARNRIRLFEEKKSIVRD